MKIDPKLVLRFIRKNAPSILSVMACGGVTLTGFLTHEAAQKSDKEEPFREHWKNYIPSIIAGVGTIACVIGANCMHISKEAALTGAVAFYKALSDSGKEYEEAVYEKFSDAGLKENCESAEHSFIPRNVKVRVYEPYTKQYFNTTTQELLWAELEANKLLSSKGTVKLNDVLALYKDCKPKPIGEEIGWSWDEDWFCESASYYWHGGWIDLCPQWRERNGKQEFVLDYGINPMELS